MCWQKSEESIVVEPLLPQVLVGTRVAIATGVEANGTYANDRRLTWPEPPPSGEGRWVRRSRQRTAGAGAHEAATPARMVTGGRAEEWVQIGRVVVDQFRHHRLEERIHLARPAWWDRCRLRRRPRPKVPVPTGAVRGSHRARATIDRSRVCSEVLTEYAAEGRATPDQPRYAEEDDSEDDQRDRIGAREGQGAPPGKRDARVHARPAAVDSPERQRRNLHAPTIAAAAPPRPPPRRLADHVRPGSGAVASATPQVGVVCPAATSLGSGRRRRSPCLRRRRPRPRRGRLRGQP